MSIMPPSVRVFLGTSEGANEFLRREGCTQYAADTLISDVEQYGYEFHQVTDRRLTVKLVVGQYYVRSSPTNLPAARV